MYVWLYVCCGNSSAHSTSVLLLLLSCARMSVLHMQAAAVSGSLESHPHPIGSRVLPPSTVEQLEPFFDKQLKQVQYYLVGTVLMEGGCQVGRAATHRDIAQGLRQCLRRPACCDAACHTPSGMHCQFCDTVASVANNRCCRSVHPCCTEQPTHAQHALNTHKTPHPRSQAC